MERLLRAVRLGNGAWRAPAAALATGALVVLAAPGAFESRAPALLAWVAFAPILFVLPRTRIAGAAALGFLAGMVVNLGVCPWFPGLLARFSNMHPALAVGATLAVAAYQSLGWAAWAAIVRSATPGLPAALVAPAAFVAIERWMPAVFPYSIGTTQYRYPLVTQVAELGGPYVLTFLCVLVGAALAAAARARLEGRRLPMPAMAAAVAALAATVAFGSVRLRTVRAARERAPAIRVAAVQAGVVRTAWSTPPDDVARLERYQRVSAAIERVLGPVDLLVWPEKAYPSPVRRDAAHDYRPGHPGRVRAGFASPLVFGLTSVDPRTRDVWNSAALLDRYGGIRVFYDKVKLIFYSERLPSWLEGVAPGGKRYRPGTRLDPLVIDVPDRGSGGGVRRVPISFFICFESTFPDYVRELTSRGPQLLVNLSDDSWFGDSAEPEQHLAQAVFRAVESRRDLLRATGSGVSALVAATGEIERRTPLNRSVEEADRTLVADARLLSIPGIYKAAGDLFPAWCALVAFGAVGLALLRAQRRR